jgi:hemolysin III
MDADLQTTQAPARVKPRYRGVSHEFATYAAGLAGCRLVAEARGPGTTNLALISTVAYSLSLFFLFGVSALYHRPTWSPAMRQRIRRIDHSTIFLMIAGTATPVVTLCLAEPARSQALVMIWIGAGLGLIKALFWAHAPKPLTAAIYLVYGCVLAAFVPGMTEALGANNARLLLGGGLLYAIGAIVYALKRPDPSPAVFGYHEIFHAFIIAAAAVHYLAITRLVESVARASGF